MAKTENLNKAMVYKDNAGQWWFLGLYSNNFKDKEGESFAWDGHKEFAAWVKQTGVKFPITIMHQPKYPSSVHLAQFLGLNSGLFDVKTFSDNYQKLYKPFAFAQTEMILPLDGFMFVVGKILKGKEDVAESLMQTDSAWGMSHGFIPFETSGKIINKYRTFEFTVCPPALAANAITLFDVKETNKMDAILKGLSANERETLKELLEVDPGELEDATKAAKELLAKVMSSKQLDGTDEEETTEEVEEKSYDEIKVKLFSDLDVDGLQTTLKQVVDEFGKVDSRLEKVEGRLASTEKSEDEKIAEKVLKPDWKIWGEVKGDEDVDLVEELKETALGSKPLVEDTKEKAEFNPLGDMLWKPLAGK